MAEHNTDFDSSKAMTVDVMLMEWTCHPAKRRPWVTALVTIFAITAVVVVYFASESRLFAALALLIMWGSLAKFYFATTYILSEQRITIKTLLQTLHKDWSQFRSSYPDKNGILLSPFPRPSRLENFRGLYLMFEGNRDAVTACVKSRMARQVQVVAEKS